jgi:hypothetical protein
LIRISCWLVGKNVFREMMDHVVLVYR